MEGPWTEKDFQELPKLCWPYNQENWDNPLPWMKDMFEYIGRRVKRTIYCIVDPEGNKGKTSFIKKAKSMGLVREIPPMTSMEDIMAWVMSFPPHKGYVIDMPRSMPKNKLCGFYAGIESLKNGSAYDKRYHGKEMDFDSPNVVVFTNKKPKLSYLSRDRWRLFGIKDKRLVDYCFVEKDGVQKKVRGSRKVRKEEEDDASEEDLSVEEEVSSGEERICESSEECDSEDSGEEV